MSRPRDPRTWLHLEAACVNVFKPWVEMMQVSQEDWAKALWVKASSWRWLGAREGLDDRKWHYQLCLLGGSCREEGEGWLSCCRKPWGLQPQSHAYYTSHKIFIDEITWRKSGGRMLEADTVRWQVCSCVEVQRRASKPGRFQSTLPVSNVWPWAGCRPLVASWFSDSRIRDNIS